MWYVCRIRRLAIAQLRTQAEEGRRSNRRVGPVDEPQRNPKRVLRRTAAHPGGPKVAGDVLPHDYFRGEG
jgi:hypothetical protein